MTVIDVHRLREIAEVEFDAVVLEAYVPDLNELRIFIQDGSFVDVWRKAIDGTIYRHDNAPHQRWQSVSTFPHHFHDGSEAAKHHIMRLSSAAC